MGMIYRVVLATTLLVSGLAMVPSAQARAGDVVRHGTCSASSTWKLKLRPDNGRIELEFEVDSNHAGQTWHVRVAKNGGRIFRGTRMTKAPSGSLTVQLRPDNSAGTDVFRASATNPGTGETCVGRASIG